MNTLLFLFGLIGTIFSLWYFLIAIFGSARKAVSVPAARPRHRFAVLIPARNEAGVIGYLVRSLLNQEYPRELYDIFVIPNGCTDDTANQAAAAGARILECDRETHSKGDVLRFAFERIPQLGEYDAYCILDADNLAAPGFLRAANDMLCAGWQIAQGRRESKNPSDSWIAGDTSIFFWLMNRFYNRARTTLGMSCALNGTGIVLTSALVEKLGWHVRTLTEDLEFSGICAMRGIKIGYMDAGVVYDEQPVGLKDSLAQRRRWFAGSMQCLKLYGGQLLKRHSIQALDILLVYAGCVMQALGILSCALSATIIIRAIGRGELSLLCLLGQGALLLVTTYVGMALLALIVCLSDKKRLTRPLVFAILMFPIFIATWLPANLWGMFTPPPKWKQIAHVRGVEKPE